MSKRLSLLNAVQSALNTIKVANGYHNDLASANIGYVDPRRADVFPFAIIAPMPEEGISLDNYGSMIKSTFPVYVQVWVKSNNTVVAVENMIEDVKNAILANISSFTAYCQAVDLRAVHGYFTSDVSGLAVVEMEIAFFIFSGGGNV